MLTPDVRLVQPLTRTIRGLPAAEAWKQRLLTALPSLRSDVESWSVNGDVLFIAFRLRAAEPTFQLEWPAVDYFRLRSGLAYERLSFFDSLLLLRQVTRQPRAWLRFMRWASSEWLAAVRTDGHAAHGPIAE